MDAAAVVAAGYDYPNPGQLGRLREAVETSVRGVVRRRMTEFLDEVGRLALGEWEELHTDTLDLSPLFIPYVGHVQWGENYRRGEFMADLNREMATAGIDLRGELPDHIAPILRYLAVVEQPLSDLLEVLPEAVSTMQATLVSAAADNPYRHLLAATVAVVEDLSAVTVGGRT